LISTLRTDASRLRNRTEATAGIRTNSVQRFSIKRGHRQEQIFPAQTSYLSNRIRQIACQWSRRPWRLL